MSEETFCGYPVVFKPECASALTSITFGSLNSCTRTEQKMTDTECLDWLDANTERLREVYWYIENEGGTVRDAVRNAISVLARLQAEESDSLS